jgi:hypothetical protein
VNTADDDASDNPNAYALLLDSNTGGMMSLDEEIEKAARQVSTDAFSLTIGELANMYRDGDILINPH